MFSHSVFWTMVLVIVVANIISVAATYLTWFFWKTVLETWHENHPVHAPSSFPPPSQDH